METSAQRKLFRQTALDRLVSPEQLDQLVTMTDSHSWVALLSIVGMFALLIIWGIFGSLSPHVKGRIIFPDLPVQTLTHIATVEPERSALVYIPTEQAKKLHVGMPLRIALAPVKKQEFCALSGVVRRIADIPSYRQKMPLTLRNGAALTVPFAQNEQLSAVYMDLSKSAHTVSAYRWTTGDGSPFRLAGETMINAEIILPEQRPVSLLIPLLRKVAGIEQ